jgi:CDP-6-deoxy-D-xylo-4-hexulose-3-dehydrase
MIFAGNILHQPAYRGLHIETYGDMINSDKVMRNSFFIGIHPGLNIADLDYMYKVIGNFMEGYR